MSSEVREQLAQARAQLQEAVAQTRAAIQDARRRMAPTAEEQERLQRDALAGELGPKMQRLARLVEAGDTTWPAIFAGQHPEASLLSEHLDRMGAEHGPALARALAEDEELQELTDGGLPGRPPE